MFYERKFLNLKHSKFAYSTDYGIISKDFFKIIFKITFSLKYICKSSLGCKTHIFKFNGIFL